jgi:DNA-binding winged helix-turn-helix (wHTH) protein/TolB-like protein
MSSNTRQFAHFGDFVFDLRQRVLTRDGQIVPVAPKDLEVLLVLVRDCGQIVEKKQIIEKIWPDTFVEEANLSRHVFNLRRILSENGQRSIDTVPKRGYRFIAPVRFSELMLLPSDTSAATLPPERAVENSDAVACSTPAQPTVPDILVTPRQGLFRWHTLVIACAAFLATGAVFGVLRARAPHRVSLVIEPVQNLTGDASKGYIAEGFTDELTTRIAASNPAVVLVTQPLLPDSASAQATSASSSLAGGYLLSGSLRESTGRFRITMKLVRLPQRELMWCKDFDRDSGDLIGMQDEVSQSVAKLLPVRDAALSDNSPSAKPQ